MINDKALVFYVSVISLYPLRINSKSMQINRIDRCERGVTTVVEKEKRGIEPQKNKYIYSNLTVAQGRSVQYIRLSRHSASSGLYLSAYHGSALLYTGSKCF